MRARPLLPYGGGRESPPRRFGAVQIFADLDPAPFRLPSCLGQSTGRKEGRFKNMAVGAPFLRFDGSPFLSH